MPTLWQSTQIAKLKIECVKQKYKTVTTLIVKSKYEGGKETSF
jgi:hypothetical protein